MSGIEEAALRLLDHPGLPKEAIELILRSEWGISAEAARETAEAARSAQISRAVHVMNLEWSDMRAGRADRILFDGLGAR